MNVFPSTLLTCSGWIALEGKIRKGKAVQKNTDTLWLDLVGRTVLAELMYDRM